MKNISQRASVVGLVLGVLLIPAIVFASTALLANGDGGAEPERSVAPTQTARAVVEAPAESAEAEVEPVVADLAVACGSEGNGLADLEASGEITPLEQAALDALRPICADAGLSLPELPVPAPVVIIETVMTVPIESSPPPAVEEGEAEHDDDDDHDADDDDDHDEDDD